MKTLDWNVPRLDSLQYLDLGQATNIVSSVSTKPRATKSSGRLVQNTYGLLTNKYPITEHSFSSVRGFNLIDTKTFVSSSILTELSIRFKITWVT